MRLTAETVGIRLFVCLSVSVCQAGSLDLHSPRNLSVRPWIYASGLEFTCIHTIHVYCHDNDKIQLEQFVVIFTQLEQQKIYVDCTYFFPKVTLILTCSLSRDRAHQVES